MDRKRTYSSFSIWFKTFQFLYRGIFRSLGIAILLVPLTSHASLSEYLGVGNAKAISLGNAVTADPPGIDSIIFNPAGLVRQNKGIRLNFKGILPSLGVEADIYHPDNSMVMSTSPDNSPGMWSFMCLHDVPDPEFWGYDNGAIGRFRQECERTLGGVYDSADRTIGPSNRVIHSETNGIGFMLPGVKLQNIEGPMAGGSVGMSWSPQGSQWTFATGVYADMLGLGRSSSDPGRFEGQVFSMVRLSYLTPTFAYRVSDAWSLGMSMTLSWQGIGMEMQLRLPTFGLQFIDSVQDELCTFQDVEGLIGTAKEGADMAQIIGQAMSMCGASMGPYTGIGKFGLEAKKNVSVGFNFGVLWEPTVWFTWGATYRPEVKDKMSGKFDFNYSENWSQLFGDMRLNAGNTVFSLLDVFCNQCMPYGNFPGTNIGPNNTESGNVTVEMTQPAIFSTGISVKLTDRFKLNVDARWTDYQSWDVMTVDFQGQRLDFLRITQMLTALQYPGQDFVTHTQLGIPFWFKSVWHWAVGTEYQYSDRLVIRAGWEPRKSAIPADRMSLFAPFGDVDLYGMGLSYYFDPETSVDIGAAYLLSEVFIPGNSSSMVNSVEWNNFILNPYPGSDVSTKVSGVFLEINYNKKF